MFEDGSYAEDELISVVNNFIESNNLKEANDFVSYLLTRLEHDGYTLRNLWNPLIVLNREAEALKIADEFADSDKVEAYFAMAKAHLQQKNSQKALDLIEKISTTVEKSEERTDKSEISLFLRQTRKGRAGTWFCANGT